MYNLRSRFLFKISFVVWIKYTPDTRTNPEEGLNIVAIQH